MGRKTVSRVRFLKYDAADSVADAGNPRLIVTRWHLALLDGLKAGGDLASARAAAAAAGAPDWWLKAPALSFIRELSLHGVLAFEAPRPAGVKS